MAGGGAAMQETKEKESFFDVVYCTQTPIYVDADHVYANINCFVG